MRLWMFKLLLGLLLAIVTGCRSPFTNSASPNSAQTSPATPSATLTPAPSSFSPTASATADPAPPATPSSEPPNEPLNCDNPQGNTARCAEIAYEAADRQLNRVYQQLKEGLNQQEQQQLVEVEIAWIRFRDRSCDFESSRVEAAMQPIVRYRCLAATTQSRTDELKAQADPL